MEFGKHEMQQLLKALEDPKMREAILDIAIKDYLLHKPDHIPDCLLRLRGKSCNRLSDL